MTNTIAQIKKDFFAYRNGIVADTLRKNGDPHQFIMGCQLVDVIAIASSYPSSKELAQALWDDCKHRECRMAAPVLYPVAEMDETTAMNWATEVEYHEIADVLCHRLLRHLPYAQSIAQSLVESHSEINQYTGWRLFLNLLILNKLDNKETVKQLAQKQKAAQLSHKTAQLIESILEDL